MGRASILDQQCPALTHAELTCSDLKPDNILLDEKGHVHLTDFNIAIHYSDRRLLTGVAGSLAYMGTLTASHSPISTLIHCIYSPRGSHQKGVFCAGRLVVVGGMRVSAFRLRQEFLANRAHLAVDTNSCSVVVHSAVGRTASLRKPSSANPSHGRMMRLKSVRARESERSDVCVCAVPEICRC